VDFDQHQHKLAQQHAFPSMTAAVSLDKHRTFLDLSHDVTNINATSSYSPYEVPNYADDPDPSDSSLLETMMAPSSSLTAQHYHTNSYYSSANMYEEQEKEVLPSLPHIQVILVQIPHVVNLSILPSMPRIAADNLQHAFLPIPG
jgi:hypothetical protein